AAQAAEFWELVGSVCPLASKALLLYVHRAVAAFLRADAAAQAAPHAWWPALACARLYWALLSVPGASAYGLFEGTVLRGCVDTCKRVLELACAARVSAEDSVQAATVSAAEAEPPSAALPETTDAAEGRRNPRRA